MRELIDHVGQLLTAILVTLVAMLLGKAKTWLKKKKRGMASTENEADRGMHELLIELRAKYNADRTSLYQFKNGTHYAGGISEQKLCLTHAVCAIGTSNTTELIGFMIDIRASFIAKFISDILANGYLILDTDEIEKDFIGIDAVFFKTNFRHADSRTILAVGVKVEQSRLLGILFITWRNKVEIPNPESVVKQAEMLAIRLHGH